MTSVLSSSPPGAPRSMVRALSIPRPAYSAAHRPELHVGTLRAGELVERGRAQHSRAVAIAAAAVQQGGGRLDEPLPDARRRRVPLRPDRTPHGFQRFVRGPVAAGIEAGARTAQRRAPL